MITKTKLMWALAMAAGITLGACGTQDGDQLDSGMDAPDDDGDVILTTTDPVEETTGEADATEGDEETEGPADTGCTFIDCDDDTDGDDPFAPECDVWSQDCPNEEKCMPWAYDNGGSWNSTRCTPLDDSPAQVGDECAVEGGGTSGVDNCEIGAMCWNSDPETGLGTCIAMCTGDESAPICDDPGTTCSITNDGVLILCLPQCDPLLQDCSDGEACYPVNDHFACAPDASGEDGAAGDPCEFINACAPGNMCLGAAAWPGCTGSAGCCTPVCDLEAVGEECPGEGQMCEAWYEEGAAPPGTEAVGVCALPA